MCEGDIGESFGRAAEAMRVLAEALEGGPAAGGFAVAALVACPEGSEASVFTSRFTIGQGAGCGLRLADEYASTEHAMCAPGPHGWTVEDLGSTNGTWLLGPTGLVRIRVPRPVAKGDRIRVGHTVITLVPA